MTARTQRLTRHAPPQIVVAFYLWWIPLILQAILLAYIGLSLAEAARVGGPAWDILLVDALPALVTTAATVVEIIGVFRMRAGHRGWRIVLVVIGIVMVVLITSQFAAPTSLTDPSDLLLIAPLLFVLATLGAIVTMFTPAANAFLNSPVDPAH